MKIIAGPGALSRLTAGWRRRGCDVGFVPTMGALHAGHASLIRRARRDNRRVVVSIFVNPKQFGPKEDFGRSPRALRADRKLCGDLGVDAIYSPDARKVYPEGFSTSVRVTGLTDGLCGRRRPGHFEGVTTIVAQLFSTVGPCRAYFGEKDYQQLVVIRRMAEDLRMPVSVVGCPTVRDSDGLALSSRNRFLGPRDRARAARFSAALRWGARAKAPSPARLLAGVRSRLRAIPSLSIDYVELVDPRTLRPAARIRRAMRLAAAVRLGRTRLIDNLPLSC